MEAPDQPLYLDAVHAVLTLHRALRRYSKKLQCAALSGRQLALLRRLLAPGRHTIGSIAAYLFINESSASELVTKMERAGLVARSRSKQDQRIVEVAATEEGRRAAADTPLGGVPLLRERMKQLPSAELRAIYASVSRLVELLEVQNDGP